jgi:hypothetical protein
MTEAVDTRWGTPMALEPDTHERHAIQVEPT